MATLVLRLTKGTPLTNTEIDANFTNLDNDIATRATSADAVLTGNPTAPTQTVLDSDTSVATTAFVKNTGLVFPPAGGVALATTSTLVTSNAGRWFVVTGASTIQTLPTVATSPTGMSYAFIANQAFTIQGNGAENIVSEKGTVANTYAVPAGSIVYVTSNGTNWYITGAGFSSLNPALTGTPTAPTPAQFDNDTSIATSAFVKTSGITAGGTNTYTATNTLTASLAGSVIIFNHATVAGTLTLPAIASIRVGDIFTISNINDAICTITRAGTELFYANGLSGVTSLSLTKGESVSLVSGGTNWLQVVSNTKVASGIRFTPVGTLVATDVQAALAELDSEKAPSISPSFTTPALGTPSSGNLTNCTFPTLNQSTSGNALTATTAGTVTTAAQPTITSVGTLTGLTSSGAVNITNTTASTSPTTGALKVAGGVGISGAIHSSSGITFTGTTGDAPNIKWVDPVNNTSADMDVVGEELRIYRTYRGGAATDDSFHIALATGQVKVNTSIVSTSTNTGALIIPNGGVGVGGSLNVGGSITTGSLNIPYASSGLELGSNTVNTPFIDFHSSANANDYDSRIIASGGIAGIGGGTLTFNTVNPLFNNGTTTANQIVYSRAATGYAAFSAESTTAGQASYIFFKTAGSETGRITVDSASNLYLGGAAGTSRWTISNAGNVNQSESTVNQILSYAITNTNAGATSGTATSVVSNAGYTQLMQNSTANDGGAGYLLNTSATGLIYQTTNAAANQQWWVNGAKRLQINPSGQVLFGNGSSALPSISFFNDGSPDTGIYWISDGSFGFTNNTIPTATVSTSGFNLLQTPTVNGIEIGYKNVPQNAQSASYSLVASDSGKHIYSANTGAQTITVPTNATIAYAIGTTITIINNGTTAITFSTTGLTVYKAGTSAAWASGGTLAIRGLATLIKTNTDEWFISGNGLS